MNSGAYIYAGVYDLGPQADSSEIEAAMQDQGELLYHKEGVSATVSVLQRDIDASLTLQINGKVDASTRRKDMLTQVVSGHLPLLLHPNPQKVLLIGLGSGITLEAIEQYPVKEIDVLEISPEVVEASRFFSAINHDAAKDQRVDLIVGDGRNHLLLSEKRYDVIISEPSNLWIAGMAHLFTRDFYNLALNRLETGGVMCQWIQGYFMNPEDFKSLLRTFQQVFSHASLWEISPGGDYLLIGTWKGWSLDYQDLKIRIEVSEVQSDLNRVGLATPLDLLGLFVLGEKELKAYAGQSRLHTDDNIHLEFSAPVSLYRPSYLVLLEEIDSYRSTTEMLEIRWGEEKTSLREKLNQIHQARQHTVTGILSMEIGNGKQALAEFEHAIALNPQDVQANFSLRDLAITWGEQHLQQGKVEGAIRLYQRILAINHRLADVHYLLAQAYQSAGMAEQSRAEYEEARRLSPRISLSDK
jgi:spermidine synthase